MDQVVVELMAGAPPFYEGLHCKYITELADKLDQSYEGAVTDRTFWKSTAHTHTPCLDKQHSPLLCVLFHF